MTGGTGELRTARDLRRFKWKFATWVVATLMVTVVAFYVGLGPVYGVGLFICGGLAVMTGLLIAFANLDELPLAESEPPIEEVAAWEAGMHTQLVSILVWVRRLILAMLPLIVLVAVLAYPDRTLLTLAVVTTLAGLIAIRSIQRFKLRLQSGDVHH